MNGGICCRFQVPSEEPIEMFSAVHETLRTWTQREPTTRTVHRCSLLKRRCPFAEYICRTSGKHSYLAAGRHVQTETEYKRRPRRNCNYPSLIENSIGQRFQGINDEVRLPKKWRNVIRNVRRARFRSAAKTLAPWHPPSLSTSVWLVEDHWNRYREFNWITIFYDYCG